MRARRVAPAAVVVALMASAFTVIAAAPASALPTPTTPLMTIAAGESHSCAITQTGGVDCWGNDDYGQLGDGGAFNGDTPVPVSGLSTGVVALSASFNNTCALTSAGAVKCWGDNQYGQIGDGTTNQADTPVGVDGLSFGVAAISVGETQSCAVTTAGAVKCWGDNSSGQLGDGTQNQRLTPVDVSGLSSGVVAVATGGLQDRPHTCALLATGGMKCWGNNDEGELGDNSGSEQDTPVSVSGLTSGVRAITVGGNYSCAVTTAGAAKCWGDNSSGQLGDNSGSEQDIPVTVFGLSSGVTDIAAATNEGDLTGQTCALTVGGAVKCWGDNNSGQLGDGTNNEGDTPVNVVGMTSGATEVVTSGGHTCAMPENGVLKCWGDNSSDALGDGSGSEQDTPVNVLGGPVGVALGQLHICALRPSGLSSAVKCYGDNTYGQLGNGTFNTPVAPVSPLGLTSGVVQIAASHNYSCALTDAGVVKCWGDGQSTPTTIPGLQATSITVGYSHACAVTTTGGAKCWGSNTSGQLGDGTGVSSSTPVDVSGLTSGVFSIEAGGATTCAAVPAGTLDVGVKCWGDNFFGQVGDGLHDTPLSPVDVSGVTLGASGIGGTSATNSCWLTNGGVKCWGFTADLGDNDTSGTGYVPPAVTVTGLTSGVQNVVVGFDHSCALTSSNGMLCWGGNTYGELGDGTTTRAYTPVGVSGLSSNALAMAADYYDTAAVTSTGVVDEWGNQANSSTPTPVAGMGAVPMAGDPLDHYAAVFALPNRVSIGNAGVVEGSSGTRSLTFTVSLASPSVVPVSVKYATANGTAHAGSDYTAKTGTLTIAPGVTSGVVTVPVTGDTTTEAAETLKVNLSAPTNALLGISSGTGTILNDDPPLSGRRIGIGSASVEEGRSGTRLARFTISLSSAAAAPVTVHYATVAGSAHAVSDYTTKTGVATIAPGSTSTVVAVPVVGDLVAEPNESFTVKLSLPSAGTLLGPSVGTGTIVNDD